MQADLTRDTFEATRHFSRVLIQQGRVPLDADLNEQAAILLHYLRSLARDLIGPYGAPTESPGFAITLDNGKLKIGKGRYYVDGLLVECEEDTDYYAQPDLPLDPQQDKLPTDTPYAVALHVWERHKSAAEDEQLLEPALGGPDTASRTQVVWQVRAYPPGHFGVGGGDIAGLYCEKVYDTLRKKDQPSDRMRARIPTAKVDTDPCVLSPTSRYRGLENQLYRVEIHADGEIEANDAPVAGAPRPTFKWSRENGSVVLPLRSLRGNLARVETFGRDDRLGVHEGDMVEVVDDSIVLRGVKPGTLATVTRVDRDATVLELDAAALPTYEEGDARHPLLRRWDQRDPARATTGSPQPTVIELALINGAVPVSTRWIDLEHGIQVQFEEGTYRAGDYWLIPARTATGDIQWPLEKGADNAMVPSFRPPRGLERHTAPLAIVRGAQGVVNCRQCFNPGAQMCD